MFVSFEYSEQMHEHSLALDHSIRDLFSSQSTVHQTDGVKIITIYIITVLLYIIYFLVVP